MYSTNSIYQTILTTRPSVVRDPEVSPVLFINLDLKTISVVSSVIVFFIYLLKAIYSILRFLPCLLTKTIVKLDITTLISSDTIANNVVLWEHGLWGDNIEENVPKHVYQSANIVCTFKFKIILDLSNFKLNIIDCYHLGKTLFDEYYKSISNVNLVNLLIDLVWFLGGSWMQQISLYRSLENNSITLKSKSIYYPYEMFANARCIWGFCCRHNIVSCSSLHTHFSSSKKYFSTKCNYISYPNILYVPNLPVKQYLCDQGYAGKVCFIKDHPRLKNHFGRPLNKDQILTEPNSIGSDSFIIASGLIFDVINCVYTSINIAKSNNLQKFSIIIKLHPCDSQFQLSLFLCRAILLLYPGDFSNIKVLPKQSKVNLNTRAIIVSCGSYFGYNLLMSNYSVFFAPSHLPTLLNPHKDIF